MRTPIDRKKILIVLCLSIAGCRSVNTPRTPQIRTIASIGDRPQSAAAGEPGNQQATEPEASPTRAEEDREIRGRVVDDRGNPVANATVRVALDGSRVGKIIRASTDPSGRFTLHDLRPDSDYTLIAEDEQGGAVGRAEAATSDQQVRITLKGKPKVRQVSEADEGNGTAPEDEAPGDGEIPAPPPAPRASRGSGDGLRDRSASRASVGKAVAWRGGPRGTEPSEDVARSEAPEIAEPAPDREPPAPVAPTTEPRDLAIPTSKSPAQVDRDDLPAPRATSKPIPAPEPRPIESPRPEPGPPEPEPAPIAAPPKAETPSPAAPASEPQPAPAIDPPGPVEPAPAEPARPTSPEPAPVGPTPEPAPTTPAPVEPPGGAEPAPGPAPTPLPAAPEATEPVAEKAPEPKPAENPAPAPIAAPEPAPTAPATTPGEIQAPPQPEPKSPKVEAPPEQAPEASQVSGNSRLKRPTWGELASRKPPTTAINAVPSGRRRLFTQAKPGQGGETAPEPAPTVLETACQFDPKTQRLINFRLPDLQGNAVELRGIDSDYILIDFWGTWCGPCLETIPHLVKLQERYGDRVRVVGIAYPSDDSPSADQPKAVEEVAKRLGINYTVLLGGSDGKPCPVQAALHVQAYPTMILIDRQGRILWRDSGALPRTLARLDHIVEVKAGSGAVRR